MQVGKSDISWRTFVLIVGGLFLLVVFALLGVAIRGYLPPDRAGTAAAIVTDAGSIVFGLLAAAVLFYVALRFTPGSSLRRVWLSLGIGFGVYAVGDIIWTVLEVNSGFAEVPYPSLADVAYLSMYVFVAAGLFRAARAFRRVAKVDVAVMVDTVLMLVASVAVYVFVAGPIIVDSTMSVPQKLLGVAYPIGDIVVLLGPAVFIAFVASVMGRTQTVRHWWVLAVGLMVMSISDLVFTWLDWTGRYFSGHPVDFGWMLSLLLIAVAGSLAADVSIGNTPPTLSARSRVG